MEGTIYLIGGIIILLLVFYDFFFTTLSASGAVITASVLIHGVTSVPFSRLYHRNDKDDIEGDSDEEKVGEAVEV